MRPVENRPPLQDEAAAVMTTKLMIPAAAGTPIAAKTMTNGLSPACSSVHGITDMITISAPM